MRRRLANSQPLLSAGQIFHQIVEGQIRPPLHAAEDRLPASARLPRRVGIRI